ncbi:MAG: virulence RhuM family protein, partial [Cetobacterium sp.]
MNLEINQINNQEVLIYEDGKTGFRVEVGMDNETVWLTQKQMSELFGKDRTVITRHINNIFKEGELEEKSNVQKMHFTNSDKPTMLYNLDVIISVGYRVKSKQGTQFRIWATKLLKEHLIRGYTLNEKRLKQKVLQLEELQNTIKILERTVQNHQIQLDEAEGLFKVISEYSYALDLLDS